MLEKYARLAQTLGRFPTAADCKMEHSRDPSFPNQKTLFNRLGPKSQQAQAILSFCERTAGFDDVAALCRPFAGGTTDTDDEPLQRDDGPFGFVYLMRSGKFYKVGRSNSAERRAYEVQLALPEELVLVHKIKTDDPSGIEAYWHARFASRRLRGEWFDLRREDIVAFRRRKFM